MDTDSYEKLLQETKHYYFQIGRVYCPALGGQYVHFNKHGFNHILRKGRKYRKESDQIRRMLLFRHVVKVLTGSGTLHMYNVEENTNSIAHFWTILGKGDLYKIRIIIRKLNNGTIHFFSVMNE